MTEPRALITRRYSKVKGLRARGILSPATPPCEIDGCRNRSPLPDHRGRGTGYVYEHCHQHDYIRGVTCGPCNVQMTLMDARVDTCASWPRFGAYLAWWLRCPSCTAGPPWEPWLTAYEYDDAPMLVQLRDLAQTEPGTAARDQALMLLALHGRAIISRRYYRARKVQRAAAHAVLVRLRTSVGGQVGQWGQMRMKSREVRIAEYLQAFAGPVPKPADAQIVSSDVFPPGTPEAAGQWGMPP